MNLRERCSIQLIKSLGGRPDSGIEFTEDIGGGTGLASRLALFGRGSTRNGRYLPDYEMPLVDPFEHCPMPARGFAGAFLGLSPRSISPQRPGCGQPALFAALTVVESDPGSEKWPK
jgi:hypothetical protein